MKLVERKCPNCGAKIIFNKEDKEAKCNYCNSSFSVEKDYGEEVAKIVLERVQDNKLPKFLFIFIIVFIFLFSMIFIVNVFNISRHFESFFENKETYEIDSNTLDEIKNNSLNLIREYLYDSKDIKREKVYILKNSVSYKVHDVYLVDGAYFDIFYTGLTFDKINYNYGYFSSFINTNGKGYSTISLLKDKEFDDVFNYEIVKEIDF